MASIGPRKRRRKPLTAAKLKEIEARVAQYVQRHYQNAEILSVARVDGTSMYKVKFNIPVFNNIIKYVAYDRVNDYIGSYIEEVEDDVK